MEAADQILAGVDLLRAACRRRAEEHRATPAIGRSHGIHAEPITAGLVFAGFYAELGRARATLVAARSEIAVGKIAGAVGTYANLEPAVEVQALAVARACVRRPSPRRSWRAIATPRYFAALARIGTAVERMALTVRHWQRTEVGEATEAFGKGQKGSSAMPHKKNPILVREPVRARAAAARRTRGRVGGRGALARARHLALVGRAGDRPGRHGRSATSWFGAPPALVDGLVVNADRMRANLELTGGLFFSEAVLLELVRKGMARQAPTSWCSATRCGPWRARGASARSSAPTPTSPPRLTAAEIDRAFDLDHHLRHAGAIIDRALADKDD